MAARKGAVGLVIRHEHGRDSDVSAIVRAIAVPLLADGMQFLTKSVDDEASELSTYRLWARTGGIAGVIVLGVDQRDTRVRVLQEMDMPFAALTFSNDVVPYPAVRADRIGPSRVLGDWLEHRHASRRVHITSQPDPGLLVEAAATEERPIETVHTDDVLEAVQTIAGTCSEAAPAILIFDSDREAASALDALEDAGIAVPSAVALLCFSDSLVCQSARRPITAIDRHGREIGAMLGAAAIAAISGERLAAVDAPDPIVVERETT